MVAQPILNNAVPPVLRPDKPKLIYLVRHACRVRHYSIRTEEAFVHWICRFILFHGKRHPRDMGAAEINRFLTHLAVDGNVSASTQNQAFAAPRCDARGFLSEPRAIVFDTVLRPVC